jgi:hypothetical protein
LEGLNMPTYPVSPPVLNDPVLTINRFLNSPTSVARRIRDITDQHFIAEKLLGADKVKASGGAVLYGVSESIYTDRDPRLVNAGAEYPRAISPDGTSALALTSKYGQDVALTDEKISREQGRSLNQALIKSANRSVRYVDGVVLNVINTAVTQTQAAVAAWSNSATSDPLKDVNLAIAQVSDLGEDYMPDILVTSYQNAALLKSTQKIISGMPRESNDNLTTKANFGEIAGLMVWAVPAARMPAGVGAFIADSNSLGFMAWEDIQSPEYAGSPDGIQTWTRRDPSANDSWLIRTRRIFAPAISDPNAAIKITGV